MEPIDSESPKLCHEWKVYKSLGSALGIPCMLWFGTEWNYKAMVMNLLGPSLEDLFTACNHTFCLKTVLMLADQLVSDRPSHPSAYELFFFLFYFRSLHSPTSPIGLHSDSTRTGPPANFYQIVNPSPSPIRVESKWNLSSPWNSKDRPHGIYWDWLSNSESVGS